MKKSNAKEYWKYIAIKAVRTFIQSFIGILVAAGTDIIAVDVWTNAALSGFVAMLSAIQNGLEQYQPSQTYK